MTKCSSSFHLCRTLWSLRMCTFKRKKYNHKYCFHSQGQPISTATKTYTGEPLRSSLVTEEFPMSYWPAVKYFLLVRMLLEGFSGKFLLASYYTHEYSVLIAAAAGPSGIDIILFWSFFNIWVMVDKKEGLIWPKLTYCSSVLSRRHWKLCF